jgi:hypothetical protein
MAAPTKDSKIPDQRRRRGFERASTLVKGQLKAPAEKRGFAEARLLTHWEDVVGAEIAAIALPLRITYGRGFGGTLVLLTTGAHAPVLEMRGTEIVDRVNACYGYRAVSRVQVTQTAPTGFAEGQVAFRAAPKARTAGTRPRAPRAGDGGIERDRGRRPAPRSKHWRASVVTD